MQGTIAQTIALTTFGNAFLRGSPGFEASSFYPANSAFGFCETVRFVDLKPKAGGWEENPYASDPPAWFDHLRRDGVSGLRLVQHPSGDRSGVPDRVLEGFVGGGGRWRIGVRRSDGTDSWEGHWDLGDRDREDRRIWRVTYGRVGTGLPAIDLPAVDLAALQAELSETLGAIRDFARSKGEEGFARAFETGLAALRADDPYEGGYPGDLAPRGALSLDAARLLGAARTAWVFGGMGSWNDLAFRGADQARYEGLSQDLYDLLNAALVAAANASASPGG